MANARQEHLAADDAGDATSPQSSYKPANHNAFSELMKPKTKASPKKPTSNTHPARFADPTDTRAGLLTYIISPESHPPSRVIYHNPSFVVINDMFPKATIHLLLLPRDLSKTLLDPRIALSSDPAFLTACRNEAAVASQLAAKELARRFGPYSQRDRPRINAMESTDPPNPLPAGRDWLQSIKVGVHAHPSMSHLHIHILSIDMHSSCMKHRKHYNSFNTDFFIPLDAFPLPKEDPRWQIPYQNANLEAGFKCWRCGEMFGNKFTKLKQHLETEFQEWRAE